MGIRVYNTLTRQKEDFVPVVPGKVGMYVCGPTVYSLSHIGHMVGPVIFDAIKRYLTYSGFEVNFVINITDIDDKIINTAAKQKIPFDQLAKEVTADYQNNLKTLAVEVDKFPHATETIPEMIAMMDGLIKSGHAYAAGGDVYFDVTSFPEYGKLSNRKLDELMAGVRKEVSDVKRHPGDFAMWKGAKPGEPAWASPWGPGRPGWHIECSAMSAKLLGKTIDIHGGGLDLCFPHHEDEIAQSEAFHGQPFAKYWLHNGLMQMSDATRKIGAREGDYGSQEAGKMSKSKGNVITIRDLVARHSAETIRFFLLSTHYRRPIDFSEARLEEVGKGISRFVEFRDRFERLTNEKFASVPFANRRTTGDQFDAKGDAFLIQIADLRKRFLDFMDDDFNTGGGVGVLFEVLPALNRFIDEQKMEAGASPAAVAKLGQAAGVLRELLSIIGIFLPASAAKQTSDDGMTGKLLDLLLDLRQEARKTKNFPMSDAIRNRLADLGVTIEDGPQGSRWKVK